MNRKALQSQVAAMRSVEGAFVTYGALASILKSMLEEPCHVCGGYDDQCQRRASAVDVPPQPEAAPAAPAVPAEGELAWMSRANVLGVLEHVRKSHMDERYRHGIDEKMLINRIVGEMRARIKGLT
jgi:hypothetical protein